VALTVLLLSAADLRADEPIAQDPLAGLRAPFLYPEEVPGEEQSMGWYVRGEALYLQRSKSRSQTLSFADTINAPDQIILKTSDVDIDGSAGYRITAGTQWNESAWIDLSFFSVPQWSGSANSGIVASQQIEPYWNSQQEDFDTDSFSNAYLHTARYESSLYNAEANLRGQVAPTAFVLVGLRYLHLGETFVFHALDEPPGSPDGTLPGHYDINTRNDLVGPQIGFQYDCAFEQRASVGLGDQRAHRRHR
jgi:hypothetical protein